MKRTVTPEGKQMAEHIQALKVRNEKLEAVLEAARRMLRTRTRLDNPLLLALDRAVNAAEGANLAR